MHHIEILGVSAIAVLCLIGLACVVLTLYHSYMVRRDTSIELLQTQPLTLAPIVHAAALPAYVLVSDFYYCYIPPTCRRSPPKRRACSRRP